MTTDIIELRDPAAYEIAESNPMRKIELVGRTCYNSLSRITDISAEPFVRNLMERGHETPLESARIIVTHGMVQERCSKHYNDVRRALAALTMRDPDIMFDNDDYPLGRTAAIEDEDDGIFCPVAMNVRDLLHLVASASRDRDYAIEAVMQMLKYADVRMPDDYATIRIETDRGIGNELVRHRVLAYEDDVISAYTATADDMSMVQASTRYIKWREVPVPIMKPLPLPWEEYGDEQGIWLEACRSAAKAYRDLIALGQTPQYARNVLPLSTATTIVMTGTADQWRAFLKLRLDYAAHPQMRYIAGLIRKLPSIVRLIPLGTLKTDEEN